MKQLIAISLLLTAVLTGCAALDVVRSDSVRAFGDLLAVLPAEGETDGWSLTAPDGGARFAWDNQGVSMTVDIRPFIAAGLDTAKLENRVVSNDMLFFFAPGFNMLNLDEQTDPLKQFEKDLGFLSGYLGYHMEMGHYTLEWDGAAFEWAKDISGNDKDIVFALDPESLIAASVDPEKVEGWAYSKVSVHVDGQSAEVWKLLKPFDLQ